MKPIGELDLAGVPTVMAEIDRVLVDQDQIVVDLRGLTFLDSTGLRMMLTLHNGHYPAKVVFVEPSVAQVRRILELVAVRDRSPGWRPAAEGQRTGGGCPMRNSVAMRVPQAPCHVCLLTANARC